MAWSKLLRVLQLIVPVIVAAYLLHFQTSGWRSSERLAQQVSDFRATVAIFVQVVAVVIGMLQVQALRMVL